MWIPQTCRLLGELDIFELKSKLLSLLESVWSADEALRQQLTLARPTESVFVQSIAADRFVSILEKRPLQGSDIERRAGWDAISAVVAPIVRQAIAHFSAGGVVTRIQFARMPAGAEIAPHVDQSKMLIAAHRLHLPITTNDGVQFTIDGQQLKMEVGKLYELNNRVQHGVVNQGAECRIHLIIDYLPPENNCREALTSRQESLRKQRLRVARSASPAEQYPAHKLPKVIVSSVVRGAHKTESHGGIYLVDLATSEIEQVVDWNRLDISWEGRGWDRGLRGTALYQDEIFVAASDELFCFDRNFQITASWKSVFLRHAHEIHLFGSRLLVTSTGFDSLLAFNLQTREFDAGWLVRPDEQGVLRLTPFDPRREGPVPGNNLHINSVFVDETGIYLCGRALPFLLRIGASGLEQVARVPTGTHNARPFRGGVLFNDTHADLVAYEGDTDFCYFDVPRYDERLIKRLEYADSKLARQAFGRGLCYTESGLIVAGSSPSTVTVWDLESGTAVKSLNLSMDIRNAVHGLEIYE